MFKKRTPWFDLFSFLFAVSVGGQPCMEEEVSEIKEAGTHEQDDSSSNGRFHLSSGHNYINQPTRGVNTISYYVAMVTATIINITGAVLVQFEWRT